MEAFLTAISGLAWTIVYIDAIRIGFRQKTYAIPMAALGLNFAWESTYAVHELAARGFAFLQDFRDLLVAAVEDVVHEKGRALLWRQALQQDQE